MASAMNVFLTFDYELFLGEKTGTPENCLIRPMEELCKVADRHGVRFVIFADAAYLLKMQQLSGQSPEIQRQYEMVCDHLRALSCQGHDIQLHFHPQWLYSTWDDESKEWKMDREHYKLSDLSLSEAKTSLKDAKNLLDSIVGYKTTAFRAGGFCLDSFCEYKELFRELGIKVDSSVARDSYVSSKIHSYDFRRIPKQQIYCFSDSIKECDEEGDFVELSISSFKWGHLKYFTQIRPLRVAKKPTVVYQDGRAISDGRVPIFKRLLGRLKTQSYLASVDGEWSNLLGEYIDYSFSKGWSEIIMIGHPKNATDVSICNLDSFLSKNKGIKVRTTRDLL